MKTIFCDYYDEEAFDAMAVGKKSKLSIIHCNLQSSFKNFGLLKCNLAKLKHRFHIIAITETGTSKLGILKKLFDVFINKPPEGYKKGGIGVYIDKSCTFSVREDLELRLNIPIENIWFDLDNSFVIGVIYRHPNNDIETFTYHLEQTINIIKLENKPFVLCGDINIDLLNPDNNKTKTYIDTLLCNNIIPCISLPTRITDHSATIIDHVNFFRPLTDKGLYCGNIFFDISDHLPNFVIFQGKCIQKDDRPIFRIYDEKNIANIKTKFSNIAWQDVITLDDANDAYDVFVSKFNDEFKFCFPYKRISRNKIKKKKWLTKGLLISIKHKNRLFRRCLAKPNNTLKQFEYKQHTNKLTNILKVAEKNYYTDLILNEKKSTQALWKIYNNLMGRNKVNTNNAVNKIKLNGKVVSGAHNIANAFNEYFSTVGSKLADSYPHNDNYCKYLTSSSSNSIFLSPITEQELIQEISKLPLNKSPGIDQIPSKMIKSVAPYIIKPLVHIFNYSFTTGKVPKKLKIAKVVPIFKSKEKSNPGNYRPINLLSIFNKLLEKMMYKRLYSFVSKYDILFKHQFGFRNNYSILLALIEITDNIREEIEKGNLVIGTYLDLSNLDLKFILK